MKICNIQHRYASSSVPLHPDIPWDSIALKYELTGGFIKNAVLSALLRSVSRSSENPVVLEEDIIHGCSLQMRGSLRLRANSDSIVPSHGLDRLILNDNVRKTMESVISFEKARSVLFGQWRFDETMQHAQGTVMLVTGPHGCGKRAVCEGLAFELGRPMRVIDVSELMLNMTAGLGFYFKMGCIWCPGILINFPGEQLKISLQSVFSDARLTDSLLVIENVQDLPVSADEPTIIVACLASFLRSFPGVCVLCGACATDSSHRLHPLLKRLLRFTLHLPAMGQKQVTITSPAALLLMTPTLPQLTANPFQRAVLWKRFLPSHAPIEAGINFEELARRCVPFFCLRMITVTFTAW